MSFPRVGERRTDNNFRFPQKDVDSEEKHHKEYSILQELPIDMVTSFSTSDPLHLLELGIMKKYVNNEFDSCYLLFLTVKRYINFY